MRGGGDALRAGLLLVAVVADESLTWHPLVSPTTDELMKTWRGRLLSRLHVTDFNRLEHILLCSALVLLQGGMVFTVRCEWSLHLRVFRSESGCACHAFHAPLAAWGQAYVLLL